MLTTNAVGANTSNGTGPANSFVYDPFGNALPGSVLPANTTTGSHAYVGQHQKRTETDFTLTPIQMGVRAYIPGLGRFTSVDPIEGGTENNYVYPADPVNEHDLTGEWGGLISALSRGAPLLQKGGGYIARGASWAGGKVAQGITAVNRNVKSKAAGWVADKFNAGRARAFINDVAYDLKGKAHFVKDIGRRIPTPHMKAYVRSPQGRGSWGPTVPMQWKDIYKVYRNLRK